MSTITKTMLVGSLLVALAPAAYAAQGGTHSRHQLHAYGANRAASAYAQQGGRVTTGRVRSQVIDNPPGSAWQDRGINEDNGLPTR
jgi:hypothetical protein